MGDTLNVERACLIAYIDCATDLMQKVLDEHVIYADAGLLTENEVKATNECIRILLGATDRLQQGIVANDPENYAIIKNTDGFEHD